MWSQLGRILNTLAAAQTVESSPVWFQQPLLPGGSKQPVLAERRLANEGRQKFVRQTLTVTGLGMTSLRRLILEPHPMDERVLALFAKNHVKRPRLMLADFSHELR